MKTRYLRGNTAQLNQLTLGPGEIALDQERKAVRFGDGETRGGYEILGTRAYTPPPLPGPQELVAGDEQAGFYGEVSASELVDGLTLANMVGISEGVAFNNDSPWLKFSWQGRVQYTPLRPIRNSISWDTLYAAGAAYGTGDFGAFPSTNVPNTLQDARVDINGYQYKVRLMGGTATGAAGSSGYNLERTFGSEWNQLLYPVHNGVHTDARNPSVHTDPTAAPFGAWAQYNDEELGLIGDGRIAWIFDRGGDSSRRATRGSVGITHKGNDHGSNAATSRGWRPVLELVT